MRVVKIIGWFLIYIEKKWYICIMNIPETGNIKWSETVIIVDADFLDHVAFDLIVNFERMIGRRIPQADMAQWAVCAALDGGLRQGAERHSPGQHDRAVFFWRRAHGEDVRRGPHRRPEGRPRRAGRVGGGGESDRVLRGSAPLRRRRQRAALPQQAVYGMAAGGACPAPTWMWKRGE